MRLVIGNENYSSWSLCPQLLTKQAGIPLEEIRARLLSEALAADVARHSSVDHMSILVDGDINMWDPLAICETLAERFPRAQLQPADPKVRVYVCSICAEIHSGFTSLHNNMPMNMTVVLPGMGQDVTVQCDTDCIAAMWTELCQKCAAEGPFLSDHFMVTDASYASMVSHFTAYGVRLPEAAKACADYIPGLPTMQEWIGGARTEHGFFADDKPYHTVPDEDTLVVTNQ